MGLTQKEYHFAWLQSEVENEMKHVVRENRASIREYSFLCIGHGVRIRLACTLRKPYTQLITL